MAIIENSPLGFSSENECDCRSNDFCQVVAREDNTSWQIAAQCDNAVIVGNKKLPCEDNMVGDYRNLFSNKNTSWVNTPNSEVSIFANEIRLTNAADAANYIGSPNGVLQTDRYYVIRYTISGYTEGTIQTISDAVTPGPVRNANGTYQEILLSGANGRFGFKYGNGTSTPETTATISNIFVACIRMQQLWSISTLFGDIVDFPSQTSMCKTGTTFGLTFELRDRSKLVIGQSYKICFNVSQQAELTSGFDFNFGTNTETITAAGYYCYILEFDDDTCEFVLDAAFLGCIGDINITLSPTIRAELFDEEGNIVPGGLETDTIEDTLKASISDSVPDGCYFIGVADSCSNYKHQFFGNVLDVQKFSPTPGFETGSGNFTISPNFPADPNVYEGRIVFKNAVCCGKLYSGKISISLFRDPTSYTVEDMFVTINIGGNSQVFEPGTDPLNEIELTNVEAGCENEDIEIIIGVTLSSSTGTLPVLGSLLFEDPASTSLAFGSGQICPEMYSTCLRVMETAPCDTLLIQYRNESDALGFDYSSAGYTEADGFYNQLRIPAKVWKPNSTKTLNSARKSSGFSTKYYSDVRRKMVLNTVPLPPGIHDALSLALEHRTLLINNEPFETEQTEYAPEWNKNSMLAPVEIELYRQEPRLLNTLCS